MNASSLRLARKNTPGQEPVTLRVRTPGAEGAFTDYALPFAKRWDVEIHEQGGRVITAVETVPWDVWEEALDNAVLVSTGARARAPAPRPKDEVMDAAGLVYVILSVERKLLGQVHKLKTLKGIAQQVV